MNLSFERTLQPKKRRPDRNILRYLLTAAASALIVSLLSSSQFGRTVERDTLDWRIREASGVRRPDSSVVIAAIDQKSLDFFQKNGVAWPWPRDFYGILLDYLHTGGAKAVVFDMDFSEKDMDRLNVSGREADSSFASSITKDGSVVLTAVLTSSSDTSASENVGIDPRFILPATHGNVFETSFNSCVAPRKAFQNGASAIGVANFFEGADGVARRIPLLFMINHKILPQLSLAAYAVGDRLTKRETEDFVRTVPTDRDGEYLINWYGRGGPHGMFKYYSIASLVESAVQRKVGVKPELPPELFRNKYVIVGGTAIGLMDYISTPFSGLHPFPGVELQATILSNLLQHYYLTKLSALSSFLILITMSIIATGLFWGIRKVTFSTTAVLFLGGAYVFAAFHLLSVIRLWIPLVGPVVAALTSFAFAGVTSYVTEGKKRRELRRLMSRYISSEVINEITSSSGAIDLKGREIEATVFFSDIREFAAVSERLRPSELVENLNAYFNVTTELILNSGAMLDKYIGDAIMAVFGAPLRTEDHAVTACLTSLQLQDRLSHYFSELGGDKPVFETRIGLNSGRMVIGNIGSERRADYTVIGDSVNLASRLEGINKEFGTKIIISESTYENAKDAIEARELDLVKVKGKNTPVRIFELLAKKGSLCQSDIRYYEMFSEALELYRRKEWRSAESLFEKVLDGKPDDGPSRIYISRCFALVRYGVQDDWDGVYISNPK